MIVSVFLDSCAAIENLVGQIYTIFMEQQATSPQLAALWRKTVSEEQNHEQQFLLAKRLSSSINTKPEVFTKRLEKLTEDINSCKVQIEATRLSPVESLRLAIKIEENLAEFHLNHVRLFYDESLNMLFESMMLSDNEHIEALKKELISLQKD